MLTKYIHERSLMLVPYKFTVIKKIKGIGRQIQLFMLYQADIASRRGEGRGNQLMSKTGYVEKFSLLVTVGVIQTPLGVAQTPPGVAQTPTGVAQMPPRFTQTPPGFGRTPSGFAQTPPGIAQTPPGIIQ
jgi:hypothetical protein